MKHVIGAILGGIAGIVIALGILDYFQYNTFFNKKTINPHEYQIRLEPDAAYIYSEGELIGSCPYGSDGIDSVILRDNE